MAAFLVSILVLFALGTSYAALGVRLDRRRFPPPGEISHGFHIRCTGEGSPVILEAGIAASSVGWTLVQREVSRFAHVCSYDRPGYGWSPRSNRSRTPQQFTEDLDLVVARTGSPVVLVGHSFGAYLVQLYASSFPHKVRGLVLVDPPRLSDWQTPTPQRLRMLARGVSLSRRGAWLARLGFVRLALALLTRGAHPLAKLFGRASSGGASPVTERLVGEVRKLPPELWPVVQSHWSRADSFLAMAEHLACLPAVAAAIRTPPAVPTVIISGAHLSPSELAEHATLGRHIVADGSGHWVHLDRPDLISQAVQSMLYG